MSETESSKGDVGQFVRFVHLFIKELKKSCSQLFCTYQKNLLRPLFFLFFFFIHETKLNINNCELQ